MPGSAEPDIRVGKEAPRAAAGAARGAGEGRARDDAAGHTRAYGVGSDDSTTLS